MRKLAGSWIWLCLWGAAGMGVLPLQSHAYVKTRVEIIRGGPTLARRAVAKSLTAVLQEANKIHENQGNVAALQLYCTEEGFLELKQLLAVTGFYTTISTYKLHLLQRPDHTYEVRGIKVKVKLGETAGDPNQYLVFSLNKNLFIDDVHFAMEKAHYERLLEEGEKLDDFIYRNQILAFIEEYRTAHNRKDIDFLEKTYSDDALIIVGRVLQRKPNGDDFFRHSSLGEETIEFIRLKKKEYLERLRRVFQKNAFVRVLFDEIQIERHNRFADIYGIKIKQRWNSSTYSDEGYLFVMMDFKNQSQPVIQVRAWQPEPFADGSVIDLGDFEIIE